MAKPRIFVSSTYYDLKHIRADLERFIRDQGYEPILNEKGHIPYGSTEKLEEYCYKEIELSDILISIVGGRFGSESREDNYSISNLELKTAIDKGKQVYIFVENLILNEYKTYESNKENDTVNYISVDDIRVFKFIEEIYSLPLNNQIKGFDMVQEINQYLKEQWSGLFQSLLSENARQKEVNIIEDLKSTSKTLNQLVSYLIDQKSRGDTAIKDILLSNHPAFDELRRKISIPYRVIFQNYDELNQLVKARQYDEEEFVDNWGTDGFYSWRRKGKDIYLRVSKEIMDSEKKLKVYTPSEWKSEYIKVDDYDEDIPF
ncbi:DUF4062 domain-containing protein [Francisella uliginis]|uniref:DUF4062 domain-containing protein n=1 Tax=Francisella uliginis TaxID=573570 RepID=A0A1L4BRC3_9GAMM|nr:DUF4062 domain-containing protein [Francisella uliginis]API86394.1 hypothetical protein F7310_03060 [Francisella uliginis]